jgi:hypothetical protein
VIATASFNRPANTTPYTAGAVVCTSTVAASCAPLVFNVGAAAGVTGQVIQYIVTTSSTNLTSLSYAPLFCLSFFTAPPTLTNGDGGALLTTGAASYLGPANTTNPAIFSDGSWAMGGKTVGGTPLPFRTAGTALYGVLTLCPYPGTGTYTPASGEAITVTLTIEQ